MLAFGMSQHMILATRAILAGDTFIFLLLETVFAHMFLQLLGRFVVAIAMIALHESVARHATNICGSDHIIGLRRTASGTTSASAAAILVIVAVVVTIAVVTAAVIVVVDIAIVVAERRIMTATGIGTRRGVHAQQTAQNGIDVCFGFDWRWVR